MGTRASFWVGDPTDLENREWLGCIAWDGYPKAHPDFREVETEEDFRHVMRAVADREDFAHPEGGWPFPWDDNIFLTDFTYAFFAGMLMVASYHEPFVDIDKWWVEDERPELPDDPKHKNVPAPSAYNPHQPDSIMIVSASQDGQPTVQFGLGAHFTQKEE